MIAACFYINTVIRIDHPNYYSPGRAEPRRDCYSVCATSLLPAALVSANTVTNYP
ncbi:hypothetical protein J6590_009682 [Homalodisca vitripennis]|nr:hypothetical protein J6590_009682 [Homalodisca vitripennis]